MKNKFKSILMISVLAVAGIFGVSSALINKQVEETPVVEKAEAAAPDTGYVIYAMKNWIGGWSDLYIYAYKNSNNSVKNAEWPGTKMKLVSTGSEVYYADLGSNKSQFDRYVFNNGSSGNDNQTNDLTVTTSHNFFEKFKKKSDGNSYEITSSKLGELSLIIPNSKNNFNTSTNYTFSFSTSGDYSNRYHYSVTYTDATYKFKLYTNNGWKGYSFLNGNSGIDTTYITNDGDDNCVINRAGTLHFWCTPRVSTYGDPGYIFNGTEGKVTFTPATATVTFDKQDGSGGTSSTTATYGNAMPTISLPSRTGYTFGGYFTQTGGGGTKYYNANGTSATTWDKTVNTTLYAKWTVNTYTITYDRNLGLGSVQSTQSYTYGTDPITVRNPGVSPLNSSDWNPSAYHYFKYWRTGFDDTGTIYYPGDSFSPDSSYPLYYIQDYWDFRYKCGTDGEWVDLNHNNTGLDTSTYVHQFTPDNPETLTAGKKLYFQINKHDGVNRADNWQDITSLFSGTDNNYDTTNGIKISTSDTIFLKIKNDGTTYDCWVPGYKDVVRSISVVSSDSATSGGTEYTLNDSLTTKTDVYVQAGQYIKGGYNHGWYKVWLKSACTGLANENSTWETTKGVKCTITGVYTITLVNSGGVNYNDITATRSNEKSAYYYAQLFNDNVSTVCTGIVGGSKSLSDLKTVWGTSSSTGMWAQYANQPAATKAYFTAASPSNKDIIACVQKYDYILNLYGTSQLNNFMSRSGPYKAAIRDFSSFLLFGSEDNMSTVIIIISSSIALLSITALSILVIKKRKSKEQE